MLDSTTPRIIPGLADPAAGLLRQMLRWIAQRPRSYNETMDAWRTSCPRLSVWEDALAAGLVEADGGTRQADMTVRLTTAGEAMLDHPA